MGREKGREKGRELIPIMTERSKQEKGTEREKETKRRKEQWG